ncbi:MAG: RHS repeat-associated core domain-containing protein [Deltaproteobacteria bacterium]|nr:RHS repeat-associated core domain-containing protein [Deltaproteobacteria bacterium]
MDLVLEYDLMQRGRRNQKTTGASSAIFERTFDSAGRTLSLKYLAGSPSEKIYGYEYDVAGNLLYVKDSATGGHLADYSGFTALGQPTLAVYPKSGNISIKRTYTYDPVTNRLTSALTQKWEGGTLVDTYKKLEYQYDPNGNPLQIHDNPNGTAPANLVYNYDAIGNITFKTDLGSYTYNYGDKPHAARSAGNISLQYDLNGNMTQRAVSGGDTLAVSYNYDNKPDIIQKNGNNFIGFTYDGNGNRVKKHNYVTSQDVIYFGGLYEERNGVGIIHVYAGGERVASIRADGNSQYYYDNHLGSATIVTDQTGARKERLEYYPFGTYSETRDDDPNFPNVSYTFTDQEEDQELGLYNFRARLYDSVLGKFVSPDSIVPDPSDPQSLNRYSYVANKPLAFIDPDGHLAWFVPVIIGAVIGAASAGARSNWNFGAMITGAAIGAIAGLAGYGAGLSVYGAAGGQGATAMMASVTVGGAAGGATGGGLSALVNGGDIAKGMASGLFFGAVAGGVTGGLVSAGVPGALAATGGGFISGYAECGPECAGESALYSFGGGALSSAFTISGSNGDQVKIPEQGSPEWNTLTQGKSDVYVLSPARSSLADIFWHLVALLGDGNSHTWHTQDVEKLPEAGRFATLVQKNVPWSGESYLHNYNIFTNNCTTRLGQDVWNPSQYNAYHNYSGPRSYWWWR